MAPCRAVREGVDACPFLRRVAATQGDEYALRFAVNPFVPVGDAPRVPIFPEEESAFRTSAESFHGPSGPVPLPKFALPFAAISMGRGPFSVRADSGRRSRRIVGLRLRASGASIDDDAPARAGARLHEPERAGACEGVGREEGMTECGMRGGREERECR